MCRKYILDLVDFLLRKFLEQAPDHDLLEAAKLGLDLIANQWIQYRHRLSQPTRQLLRRQDLARSIHQL